MKITRRMNVVVKTERQFIKHSNSTKTIHCRQCAEAMLTAQVCADFFRISSRTIYRLLEEGKIHFFETAENEIYVCPRLLREMM